LSKTKTFINKFFQKKNMAKEEYEVAPDEAIDAFEEKPEDLRDNDEIDDAEEAFMEGYEDDADDEEPEEEKQEDFE
jgi:hypothetical protein